MFLGTIFVSSVVSVLFGLKKGHYMYMDNNFENNSDSMVNGLWSERVLVITKDYQIKGSVFMPKVSKKNRVLSDILNGTKRFVAIKNCEVVHRDFPNRKAEIHEFLQLNLNSIILLRPLREDNT